MVLYDEIKSLAKVPRSTYPFFTLYLNTRWDSEKQRERVRIFVKTRIKEFMSAHESINGAARHSLEDDLGKIEHYVKGLVNREWDEGYKGVGLYACSGLGIYTVIKSGLPFEDVFHCADRPMLAQAALQAHVGEPGVLCQVSGDAGRLIEFELGGARRQFSFQDEEFPGRHEQGGWSQSRYQRHVEEHLFRNMKRLAEHLVKWVDERRVRCVLLSGTETDLSLFEQQLPKRVLQVVSARLHIDSAAHQDVVEAEVGRAREEARGREDGEAVSALLDRGPGSGRGLAGPEAVAGAVGAGKVHVLYLDEGYRETGWKCFQCGLIGPKVPPGCPACGAAVESVDLGEEMVRGTLASDGSVVILGRHEGLQAAGGVAARLRYG